MAKRTSSYRPWEFLVNSLAASPLVLASTRHRIYRLAGIDLETHGIRPRARIHTSKLRIGKGTTTAVGCHFENREWVTIGERCSIGPEVFFATSSHELNAKGRRAGDYVPGPIEVGDDCWIATRALILPGVTIGRGCVIGAGAVVTSDCAPDGFYAGVPARRLRDL